MWRQRKIRNLYSSDQFCGVDQSSYQPAQGILVRVHINREGRTQVVAYDNQCSPPALIFQYGDFGFRVLFSYCPSVFTQNLTRPQTREPVCVHNVCEELFVNVCTHNSQTCRFCLAFIRSSVVDQMLGEIGNQETFQQNAI